MINKMVVVAALGLACLSTHSQTTYDYQGKEMTGNGGVETYTASLEFLGPISNPNTVYDLNVGITGNTVNTGFGISGCTVGLSGTFGCSSNVEPMEVTLNTSGNKLISADIFLGSDDDYSKLGYYYTTNVDIGSKGDSLTQSYNATGATFFSVSNATPGVWTEVRAPELSAGGALSAMALLGCCLLIWSGKPR